MNPLRRPRPFPVADRDRDGQPYEHAHPRLAAIRWLREKIADQQAGLDPFDPTIFVLLARPHEPVWAYRALELTGTVISRQHDGVGGQRLRAILEADVRAELGLDGPEPPKMADEPLASRRADPAVVARDIVAPSTVLHAASEESEGMLALRRARQAYDERQVQ